LWGKVDDVKIYDRKLENFEINELYGTLNSPKNVQISVTGGQVTISWDAVSGATSYKVYSSNTATSGFTEDTSGTFSTVNWTAAITETKKFYYVKAIK